MPLYEKPDKAAKVVTTLTDGDDLNVTDGPVCTDKNTVWWQLSGADGLMGWGIQNEYIWAIIGGGINDRVTGVAFTPDGKDVLIANDDGRVRFWNTQTGKKDGGIISGRSVAVSHDGQIIAIGNSPTVEFWDHQTLKQLQSFDVDDLPRDVNTLAFSPDGNYLLTGTGGIDSVRGVARLSDARTGKTLRTFTDEGWITHVEFSADGKMALIVGENVEIGLWDVVTGKLVRQFGQGSLATRAILSPDGRQILISNMNDVVLKDVESGMTVRSFDAAADFAIPLAFSPDRKWIAASGRNGETKIWNVKTGEVIRSLTMSAQQTDYLTFSPDGKQILIAGTEYRDKQYDLHTAWLCDVSTGQILHPFRAFNKR